MKTAGIITEYNPLHYGHLALIQAVRQQFGGDTAVICAMSGDFVQRGDFALVRRHARAEAAVRSGADLVLELPLLWAVSSAEGFAQGGVEVLTATGLLDVLAFGSECGDTAALLRTAKALEGDVFQAALRAELTKGDSFAAARQRAVAALLSPSDAALLSDPNNTLGIEYGRALLRVGAAPALFTIPRTGAAHDVTPENAGEVDFSQDFFGKPANLTVSGQLNAENFAMAFGDVYTFGPTFRAENSNTQRHAAEFWMIEPEMAFADLNDYMDTAEAMIKYIIRTVMEKCPDEMNFFNSFVDKGLKERLEHVASSDFARVSYTEAVELLKQNNDKFDYKVEWGADLQTEHERYLTEQVYQRPVFVTDYPKEIKAFYMRQNDDGKTVAAADCLVPGIGEIIGGSQREERLDVLEARIQELGMNPEDYWWYCDLRRYGAGFGLGFERMIMYLTGISNIRDVELHPRTVGNAEF